MTLRATRAALALLCATAGAGLPAGPAHADRIRDDQWHLRYLHVAEAHRISQGEGVTVAVIDTGVDPHPDLRNNLLRGADIVSGGTGDGRQDQDSHGTAMAGLIAAHGQGEDEGARGIAPKAQILPIRYLAVGTQGDSDNIAAGIEWAVSKGATVINISSTAGPSPRLQQAVEMAARSDVVVVAGVGNKPESFGIGFPAFLDGVLAVGAMDRNGNHADVSVTGRQIAISAPGVDIYSTSYHGKYRKGTGTSNSTAIVAGAAALVRSKFPSLSAAEVVHRLTATATDKGAPGRDEEYGYGVLDLVGALTADVPPLGSSAAPSAAASAAASTAVLLDAGGSNDRSSTLLIAAATVVGIGLVVALVFLRSRRRRGV